MQFSQTAIVKGATYFDGNIDGEAVKSAVIFIEEPFGAKAPTSKGFRTVEYKAESVDLVKAIFHNDFPMSAEVTFDMVATKRDKQIVVTAIKPLGRVAGQPGQAAKVPA